MSATAWHYRVRVRLVRERAGKFGPSPCCAGDIAALVRTLHRPNVEIQRIHAPLGHFIEPASS